MFLENTARYKFAPYAFSIASGGQWNLMATGDLNKDGWLDVIIGAMNLGNIANLQRWLTEQPSASGKDPILLLENTRHLKSNERRD
jgi:hypothetical protein